MMALVGDLVVLVLVASGLERGGRLEGLAEIIAMLDTGKGVVSRSVIQSVFSISFKQPSATKPIKY